MDITITPYIRDIKNPYRLGAKVLIWLVIFIEPCQVIVILDILIRLDRDCLLGTTRLEKICQVSQVK